MSTTPSNAEGAPRWYKCLEPRELVAKYRFAPTLKHPQREGALVRLALQTEDGAIPSLAVSRDLDDDGEFGPDAWQPNNQYLAARRRDATLPDPASFTLGPYPLTPAPE